MLRSLLFALSIFGLVIFGGAVSAQDKNQSKKTFAANMNWDGKSLVGYNFSDSKMFLNSFVKCKLMGAKFNDTVLHSASFTEADCTGADFRYAELTRAAFQRAILVGANFEDTDLGAVSFFGADLNDVKMKNAKNFGDMNMADMRGADLRGASLANAQNLSKVKLRGAKYDDNTVWPQGFDPKAAGAVKEESKKEKTVNSPRAPQEPKQPAGAPKETKRPEGAPPIETVKAQIEKSLWAPPLQGGTKHAYNYKSIVWDAPVKRAFNTVDGQIVRIDTYPVTIVCEVVRTFYDGQSRKETKNQSFYFYQEKPGAWTFKFVQNN